MTKYVWHSFEVFVGFSAGTAVTVPVKGTNTRKKPIKGLFDRTSFPSWCCWLKSQEAILYIRVGVLSYVRPFQIMDLRCKGAAALKRFTEASSSAGPDVDWGISCLGREYKITTASFNAKVSCYMYKKNLYM